MVELGKNITDDTQLLIDFVRRAGAGVIASNSGTGHPESAYVLLAADELGRLVLGTNAQSRKFVNVSSDPRVSLVLSEDGQRAVQLEGEVTVLDETRTPAAADVLSAQHPGATETNDPENLRILEVTVRWASYTDASQDPPVRRELTLR